ncbi:hypothetical protein FB45DRAFT_868034 [Roridomyces roridus]|uniref:Uncharacterized protein n=1 Tax=Roridomyces roridus TaxID=1738132 RepID=A0AAD7FN92_9AGAR|nr:hypothetical protein FB45DRAFT_868034 [Roridomyces roridus]
MSISASRTPTPLSPPGSGDSSLTLTPTASSGPDPDPPPSPTATTTPSAPSSRAPSSPSVASDPIVATFIGSSSSRTPPTSKSSDTALLSQPTPGPTDSPIERPSSPRHQPAAVGPIVGGAVGGLLALFLVVGLVVWLRRRASSLRRAAPCSPTSPVGEIRSASTLALDRPAPSAVIESQAAMLEKANAWLPSVPSGSRLPVMSDAADSIGSSSSVPVMETWQFRAMAERLALVEAALTARGEDLPPNYSPG